MKVIQVNNPIDVDKMCWMQIFLDAFITSKIAKGKEINVRLFGRTLYGP